MQPATKLPKVSLGDLFPSGPTQVRADNVRDALLSISTWGITTVSTSHTVALTEEYVRCDATAAPFTVTLPSAVSCPGQEFIVKKVDPSASVVTVACTGADVIDAAATVALAGSGQAVRVISLGASGYEIVGAAFGPATYA